jgi:hypothetical protein
MVFSTDYDYDLSVGDDLLPVINKTSKTMAGASADSRPSDSKPAVKPVSSSRSSSNSGMVWVNGYRRKNGTYETLYGRDSAVKCLCLYERRSSGERMLTIRRR